MPEQWMPGVEKQPQANGGSMVGGPPRALWHVTWDSLGAGGKQPAFDAVANYLKSAGFAPHLMWDPWSGRIVQFYPATTSARALAHPAGTAETNRMGSVCVQIEVFFSPGAVRDGKAYATVADTPCNGLDRIVAWLRSWGIPDVWPSGWPEWSGNSRSLTNWQTKAGHYAHAQVPANDHTDPGPMPKTMFQEDDMPLNDADKKWISGELAKIPAATWKVDDIVKAADDGTENPAWTPAFHMYDMGKRTRAVQTLLTSLAAQAPDVDEAAIVQGVLAGLAPATLADHIAQVLGPQVAGQVLDALKARLDS
jgi:hypothetical protein